MTFDFLISLDIIHPSDSDQRIDKFIKKYLPEAPLGGIYKWLRTGKIKVNRKKVEQNARVLLGDTIEIFLTDTEIASFQKAEISSKEKYADAEKREKIVLDILFEDEHMLIVNKSPGINVHPGDHKTKESSLIEAVSDYLGDRYSSLSFRPALVHRIDRDTSGAIMIAKDKSTLQGLLALLQGGKIEKIYHTIVLGMPPKARDTIRAKLLRKEEVKDEAKVQIDESGQEAVTHYHTIKANIRDKYSLLEVRLETGRTHQIRVHMSSLGCPVIGDKLYGNVSENSFARRTYGIERQQLHARILRFIHPITHKEIEVLAPYQSDMQSLLEGENRG